MRNLLKHSRRCLTAILLDTAPSFLGSKVSVRKYFRPRTLSHAPDLRLGRPGLARATVGAAPRTAVDAPEDFTARLRVEARHAHAPAVFAAPRSEEHTSELQSL